MKCQECGLSFGGQTAFARHIDEASGACIPAAELYDRGLKLNFTTWYVNGLPRATRAISPSQLVARA